MTSTLRTAAEALRPLAELAARYEPDDGDDFYFIWDTDAVKIGWLRRCREALAVVEAELARVPEDRERLARRLDSYLPSDDGVTLVDMALLREAAALLRRIEK